jgi:hypothetical protein
MSTNEILFGLLTSSSNIDVYQIDFNLKRFDYCDSIQLYYQDKLKSSEYTIVTLENMKVGEIIKNKLPIGMKKLYITKINEFNLNNFLIDKFPYHLDNLPNGLEKLKINNIDLEMNNLPTSLYFLEICGVYTKNLDNLPSSLKILVLQYYNKNIDNLPSSLETLVILCEYSLPIKNLPFGLKNFVFIDDSNSNLFLPPNIQNVWFNDSNNKLRRKLLKINPKVCYNNYVEKKSPPDIELFNKENFKSNKNYHDDLQEVSENDFSDEYESSSDYNSDDNFNHNVLLRGRYY